MKVPSLHQGHETREVLLAVNTLHFEDADKRVAIDQYELYGVSGIVCCKAIATYLTHSTKLMDLG